MAPLHVRHLLLFLTPKKPAKRCLGEVETFAIITDPGFELLNDRTTLSFNSITPLPPSVQPAGSRLNKRSELHFTLVIVNVFWLWNPLEWLLKCGLSPKSARLRTFADIWCCMHIEGLHCIS